jgi:hypothetical protein
MNPPAASPSGLMDRLTPARLIWALALASALAAVAATRVFVAFDGVRVKALREPLAPSAGAVQTVLDDPTLEELRPPFAIISRIRAAGSGTYSFVIGIDGRELCQAAFSDRLTSRIDCALTGSWRPAGLHQVTITEMAHRSDWQLEYLELATHYGRGGGLLDVRIVPPGTKVPSWPSAGVIALLWTITAGLVSIPPIRLPRSLYVIYWFVTIAIALLILAAEISSLFTEYSILIFWGAYWKWLLWILAPHVWALGLTTLRRIAATRSILAPYGAALATAAIVLGLYGAVVQRRLHDDYRGNYSGFIQISREFFDNNPLFASRPDVRKTVLLTDGGYDAQFMYAETFDPLMRRFRDQPDEYTRVADAPPYRFGRIGFVWITYLASLGRWDWFPATMVLLVLGATGLCAFLLARVAQNHGGRAFWALTVALIPGFWQSVQVALPEPIAAALLVGAYLALNHRHWLLAAVLGAVSLLIRETGAIFVVCAAAFMFLRGRRSQAIVFASTALLPLALWRGYVGLTLYSTWGTSAFFFNPQNTGAPFRGFLDLWATIARGEYFPDVPELIRAGIWYPVVVTTGLFVGIALAVVRPSVSSIAAMLYGLVAVSLNYSSIWVHVGNGQRGTYELFIMLALSAVSCRSLPKLIRISLLVFWSVSAVYVTFLAFDAAFIRYALL